MLNSIEIGKLVLKSVLTSLFFRTDLRRFYL